VRAAPRSRAASPETEFHDQNSVDATVNSWFEYLFLTTTLASLVPRSGAVNSSLTSAANALRVAPGDSSGGNRRDLRQDRDVGAQRLEICILHACFPVQRLHRMVEACQQAAVRKWS
jgi:hypothetical protein